MKRALIAAVLAATALATPAAAGDALARSLGVEPGVLSLPELVALKDAIDSDDRTALRRLRAVKNLTQEGPLVLVGYSDKGKVTRISK